MKTFFSNLKVIDLSTVLAGPSVGTFFAELGAKVIKIEHPNNLDVTRSWKLPSENSESTISAYFASVNYKKTYNQLNLSNKTDHENLLALVSDADILISNFKNGDAEKLKLTDQLLREINPNLIIGKITGFGSKSDRVAYDLILQAESGFMSMNGTSESGPVKMPVALIDVLAAHHLKEGLLAALLERRFSGAVQTVQVSLYDAAVCSLVNQASNYLMSGHIPQRIGSLHPNIAPYGEIFTTSDKTLITLAIGSNHHFSKLCTILQLDHLLTDPKFGTNANRVKNRKELALSLQDQIKTWTANDLMAQLHLQKVPAGKIKDIPEVFDDAQTQSLIREESINEEITKRVTSIGFTTST